MKLIVATAMSVYLLAAACSCGNEARAASGSRTPSPAHDPQAITITRSWSQPSAKGPAEHFTGSVRIDTLFQAHGPSRTTGGRITFEPGARTAWHSHPLGQTHIVTAGSGRVQHWSGPVEEIREGDVVWIPPVRSTGTEPRRTPQ
jgi:quercetin dioxygenase-like cupin family protein